MNAADIAALSERRPATPQRLPGGSSRRSCECRSSRLGAGHGLVPAGGRRREPLTVPAATAERRSPFGALGGVRRLRCQALPAGALARSSVTHAPSSLNARIRPWNNGILSLDYLEERHATRYPALVATPNQLCSGRGDYPLGQAGSPLGSTGSVRCAICASATPHMGRTRTRPATSIAGRPPNVVFKYRFPSASRTHTSSHAPSRARSAGPTHGIRAPGRCLSAQRHLVARSKRARPLEILHRESSVLR